MSRRGHNPIRTCVGCRKKRRKEEMIWLAQAPDGMVVVDAKKPHRGRGLYLCPDYECMNMAKKKNRGVGFLETTGFRRPSAKGPLTQEVGNGKE
ncbi:MAG TPA: YlxR family protein [Thermodesulfobacteriota bacterium]|nr:YlxR family protein [Thermodesulfobacteriota bacterium]